MHLVPNQVFKSTFIMSPLTRYRVSFRIRPAVWGESLRSHLFEICEDVLQSRFGLRAKLWQTLGERFANKRQRLISQNGFRRRRCMQGLRNSRYEISTTFAFGRSPGHRNDLLRNQFVDEAGIVDLKGKLIEDLLALDTEPGFIETRMQEP